MTIINVSAKAEHHQPPERAVLKINIKVEKKDKEEASNLARNAANQVSAIFKERTQTDEKNKVLDSAPITWWSCSNLSVSFYNYYRAGKSEKKEERCWANVVLQAKFKDFDELSNVISLLSPIPHVEIRSIEWKITDLTRESLQSNLRSKAVQDAQKQASDFASALNLHSIKCIEIQAGSNHHGGSSVLSFRGAPAAMSRSGAAGQQPEGLDLKPEDVSIGCYLDAKFEASA